VWAASVLAAHTSIESPALESRDIDLEARVVFPR
jgi:hypothetical protein